MRNLDAATIERAVELTKDGWTRTQVAAALHLPRNTICGVIHRVMKDRPRQVWRAHPSYWTPERMVELRRHIVDGLTQAEISIRMGKSIKAIANALVRERRRSGTTTPARRPHKPKPPTSRISAQVMAIKSAAVARERYVPPPAEPPTPTLCGLLELTNTTCRAPIGDVGRDGFGFCGSSDGTDNAAGHVYCRYHRRKFIQA